MPRPNQTTTPRSITIHPPLHTLTPSRTHHPTTMSEAKLEQEVQRLAVTSTKKAYGIDGRMYASEVQEKWESFLGQTITVGGWVKKGRAAEKGTLFFLEVNDGSCPGNLQCKRKVDESDEEAIKLYKPLTKTGASVLLRGKIVKAPEGKEQKFELDIEEVVHSGLIEGSYPIAKARIPLEVLRKHCHLRARTNIISAVARVRNALAQATHRFFSDNGFMYLHTPLITASDCEGAGEMFQVTTLFSKAEKVLETPLPSDEEVKAAEDAVAEQEAAVQEMRDAKRNKKTIKAADAVLQEKRAALAAIKERVLARDGIPRTEDKQFDFTKDFFKRAAYLTVSGQLQGESYACSMGNIYTFGPTFRAENSNTTRHLAEFWMIEPEIAFCDLTGCMDCAEDYVRYCCQYVLDNCRADLDFFAKFVDKTVIDRVTELTAKQFARVEYKDAVKQLLELQAAFESKTDEEKAGKKSLFEIPVGERIDLATEHERYLTEHIYKGPVILYNYPKEIKAFYMRETHDEFDSVAAMDILVPKIGELVGGSQREERLDVLRRRLQEAGLDESDYEWYLDLRRFGTVPHSGFGLGFERLIMLVTGMENIRDVIPYPRHPEHIP
ncbi:asparaginyl-tRNA synthetase [Salpingoeca rosetta]|uniref:asparagine--tRNA ligase n=1 Tax=Salpingoeca rosetta (strain ATCC 50818 / BSB-021) TaxID=946362 RepID=F2UKL7_SALR5|nr:asparaginyl-tRNA synthetase [Salpingoeca rosetta]EGD77666.1 asparaginyl-tRNA synthetase [Salpingoeca rosetta]|eukprot:XP_004990142.1 asparaginyl-tRNA synthetase [Salpingoeca rosetta]